MQSAETASATEPTGRMDSLVAILERRGDISSDLFQRYWRDVHGVLATRVPGFTSYVQYHLLPDPFTPPGQPPASNPIDGIAEVIFAPSSGSSGLASSQVSDFIRRDEQILFSRVVSIPLSAEARTVWSEDVWIETENIDPEVQAPEQVYVLFQSAQSPEPEEVGKALARIAEGISKADPALKPMTGHTLTQGNHEWWNTPNVAGQVAGLNYIAALRIRREAEKSLGEIADVIGELDSVPLDRFAIYRVAARYRMVADGQPTPLGMRGLDIMRTIHQAGAAEQGSDALLRSLFVHP
ncbi:hypothetical protein EQ718_06310 [Paracoccus versutus]|uniref:EthD domain-containing protein n=1 Tax=Paracoccus versutus TaxID=34007 RepID=A0AAQ0HI23_PARVE|nr:EthD domain-containing protein [Paracoccus versutus]REG46448.1 EthD domain-containing protein [Paracoccus versutus]WEJ78518.1 hypothetical protein EQ718_06310 [Paracoccus versutus]